MLKLKYNRYVNILRILIIKSQIHLFYNFIYKMEREPLVTVSVS